MSKFYQVDSEAISKDQLNKVPCPVCGGEEFNSVGIDNGYNVVKCADIGCGYVMVNPRPTIEQISKFYQEYYPEGDQAEGAWNNEMKGVNLETAAILKNIGPSGTVLDIGSSYGQFLKEAEKIGWQGVGIEPSQIAVDYSKKVLKSEIHTGLFEDVDLTPEIFDAVVTFYVLEHVLDPRLFLNKVHQVLKKGGVAIIRVPHQEPLMPLFKLIGQRLLQAPMHLNDFNPKTLGRLAKDIGFSSSKAYVGKIRHSSDLVEHAGALVLGGTGLVLEKLTLGKYLFPFTGSKGYILTK